MSSCSPVRRTSAAKCSGPARFPICALSDEIIVSHSLRIYGQGESQIEAMLHDRIASMVNPSVAPYAKPDECMLRVTAKAKSEAEAEEMLRGAIEEVMPSSASGSTASTSAAWRRSSPPCCARRDGRSPPRRAAPAASSPSA